MRLGRALLAAQPARVAEYIKEAANKSIGKASVEGLDRLKCVPGHGLQLLRCSAADIRLLLQVPLEPSSRALHSECGAQRLQRHLADTRY